MGLNGIVYNFAEVRANQFVETWTYADITAKFDTGLVQGSASMSTGAIRVRVHVANQRGGLAAGPFAPIVTLAFHNDQGGREGDLNLTFNVPAIQKEQWHDIEVADGLRLWERSSRIVATAADNNAAKPPEGSWSIIVNM
jgi:hypothetical protein